MLAAVTVRMSDCGWVISRRCSSHWSLLSHMSGVSVVVVASPGAVH